MTKETPPPDQTRRQFVKTTAYVVPAVLTLKARPAFAQQGSGAGQDQTRIRGKATTALATVLTDRHEATLASTTVPAPGRAIQAPRAGAAVAADAVPTSWSRCQKLSSTRAIVSS